MITSGRPVGVLLADNKYSRAPILPHTVDMLPTFASHAAVAVENIRLLQDLQARTADLARSVEELKALAEVGRAVSSTLDLDTVLTTIISRANQLSGTEGGLILRVRRRCGRAAPAGSPEPRGRVGQCPARAAPSEGRRRGGPRGGDARSLPSPGHHRRRGLPGSSARHLDPRRVPGLAGRAADARAASHRRLSRGPKAARGVPARGRRAADYLCQPIRAGDAERTAVPGSWRRRAATGSRQPPQVRTSSQTCPTSCARRSTPSSATPS